MSGLQKFGFIAAVTGAVLMLGSCQATKNALTYDRSAELSRQEYRDGLSPAPVPAPAAEASAAPDFQPVVSTPEELRLPTPLVTVSVNQTVSLRDLLFELAHQAGVDLEMDPQIHGSLIFTAKDRPFDEVVNRISAMAGLRYKFANNVLRIELDRPYIKSYNVDYLNLTRSGKSDINTTVTVGSSGGGGSEAGGGGNTGGGSSSSIKSDFSGDLWKEMDESLKHLLAATDTDVMLATLSDPLSTPLNPSPPPLPPVDPNAPAQAAPPPLPGSPQVAAMPAAAAPTLNITPMSEPLVPNAPSTYSISKQTGMISVFASERQQRQVEKFLNEFHRRATTQVLIEAKVLEVDLTDEYSTGIDWGSFNLTGLMRLTPKFTAPALTPSTTNGFTALLSNGEISVKALNRFGTVRTLSSPRITALNNQPAVVNVAQSVVYFTIKNNTTSTSTSAGTQESGGPETTVHSVPQGVLLNVIPSINAETGEVYLNVRPTITRVIDFVNDPEPQLLDPTSTIQSKIPQMMTQEMESLVRMQSGQTMVMGGLMQDGNTASEEGLPIASDIPYFGHLFKNHSDQVKKAELVIFLRATVVPGANVDDTDRRIYNTFGLDRHPARL